MALLLFILALSSSLLFAPAFARPGFPCHGVLPTSFSFPDFSSKNLQSLTLLGDAHVRDSLLQVSSASQPQSYGALFYSRPIHLNHPASSFSSSFGFSTGPASIVRQANGGIVQQQDGGAPGLAFVLAPGNGIRGPRPRTGHFGLDIGSLASLAAASNISNGHPSSGEEQLVAWIDYLGPLRTIEVRLSKSHEDRPENPVLSYRADLLRAWRKVFVGFRSLNAESPQTHVIYSWKFSSDGAGKHAAGYFIRQASDLDQAVHPQLPKWQEDWHPQTILTDDAWLDSMSDIWRIAISLLFGAVCGVATAVVLLAVSTLVRRLFATEDDYGDDASGFMYGYQALPECEEKGGANSNDKVPATESA